MIPRHPFFSRPETSAVFCIMVIASLLASAGCTGSFLLPANKVVSPHIVPASGAAAQLPAELRFSFQKETVVISLPVNGSVYYGARQADKEITIYGNVSEQEWVAKSYRTMMDDPAQEDFYTGLITGLRSVRSRLQLDDDEYLELITVFVQSIPYETIGENPPKFPVETVAEMSGDCDDKSLLLAGLLSREDYRVALLSFRRESHMAVGIVCPGSDYRNTGYAYIETTNVTYVGVPPGRLSEGVIIGSDPIVIPVGNGTRVYGACSQTGYILDMYTSTESRFVALSREAETMRAELQALSVSGDISTYNQRVPFYNNVVNRLKKNAEVHNYILSHQHDRKGTYGWARDRGAGL
jgi:hypothetical protein